MKKILFVLVLLPSIALAQTDFYKVDKEIKNQIFSISPVSYSQVLIVEELLLKNDNILSEKFGYKNKLNDPLSEIDNLISTISMFEGSKKEKVLLDKICTACYLTYYNSQLKLQKEQSEYFDAEVNFLSASDEIGARMIADSMNNLCKTKYVFNRAEESEPSWTYQLLYVYPKDYRRAIVFNISYSEYNHDLEIANGKAFVFSEITGDFLDVFPIWKYYFEPGADVNSMSESWGSEKIIKINGKLYLFRLSKEPTYWQIYGEIL